MDLDITTYEHLEIYGRFLRPAADINRSRMTLIMTIPQISDGLFMSNCNVHHLDLDNKER